MYNLHQKQVKKVWGRNLLLQLGKSYHTYNCRLNSIVSYNDTNWQPVSMQGRNYHWCRRGSCLVWFERERERERKWAKDKISISALLKGILGMWCLSGFIFVFDVGCYSGFIFAVSQILLISRHISEIRNYLW